MAHIDPRTLLLASVCALTGCTCGEPPPMADAGADAVSPTDAFLSPDAFAADDAPSRDDARSDGGTDAAADAGTTWLACEGRPLHAGALPCVDVACGVLETLEIDPPHSRNDRPDVALDAEAHALVSYTIAEGGYHAYLARRSGDSFVSARAGTAAVLAIATGTDGCGYAFLNDGAFGSGLYRIEGDAFVSTFVRGERMVAGGRLLLAPDGTLHTIGYDESSYDGFRARFDGSYVETSIDDTEGSFVGPGAIALRPDGSPQTAYFAGTAEGSVLMTQVGEEAPIRVGVLDVGTGSAPGSTAIAVGGDGRAHVLYETTTGSVGLASSGDPWTSRTLFASEPAPECPPPEVEGASCTTRDVRWAGLGLVAAVDGDALGVVSRNQSDVVSKVVCGGGIGIDPPPGPPPLCHYEEQSRTSASALHAVSIRAGTVTTEVITTEGGGRVGTIRLGPDGTLHVVTYDLTTAVRYTAVAPLD
ncbi:MAG: hypothetical protein J0L92_14235 [Deltaproteobacteria bacterium]|nr:hypothetical protein [Deltaproteobacteria bacterium]